jgi:two-component system cell cycle sensor histidine kinase PleC
MSIAATSPNFPGPRVGGPTHGAESARLARQKLTQGQRAKPEFDYELLHMFASNELGAALTIPMLAIIIALASMYWTKPHEPLLWLAVLLGARTLLTKLCSRFVAEPKASCNVPVWRRRLISAELVYGFAWAGVALVGFSPADHSAHIFIFASLIVVLTLRLLFASTVMPIVYAGTVPMTAALIGRFAFQHEPFYWALAAMAVGIHIYFIFLAKGLNATVSSLLELRAEKDALIAQLEVAKSISDEARRRAEADNLAKSRFLANISHELRTPLNAILGFSEVTMTEMMGPLNNKVYKEYAANIHSSGQHLLGVINDVLDLSRIEAGKHELHPELVSLMAVAADCHRLLQLRAEGKQLRIIEVYDRALPSLWADAKALRQISLNLLSNALKFTPPGGSITLTVAATSSGGQMLSVRDTGPGIPKEELPRVMQAFGQGSLAYHSAEGGTGLGLPIVKSLVELHGGEFQLRSELRKGTEAIVLMPAERVLRPARSDERQAAEPAPAVEVVPPRRLRSLRKPPAPGSTSPTA